MQPVCICSAFSPLFLEFSCHIFLGWFVSIFLLGDSTFFLPVQNLKISLAPSPIFIYFKKAWFAICSTSISRGETSCGWLILSRWFTPNGKLTSSSNHIPNYLILYFLLLCSVFVENGVAIRIWLFFRVRFSGLAQLYAREFFAFDFFASSDLFWSLDPDFPKGFLLVFFFFSIFLLPMVTCLTLLLKSRLFSS